MTKLPPFSFLVATVALLGTFRTMLVVQWIEEVTVPPVDSSGLPPSGPSTSANGVTSANQNNTMKRPSSRRNNLLATYSVVGKADSLSFSAENLQRTDRVPCGAHKCFFELRSHPGVGYLVTPSKQVLSDPTSSHASWFRALSATWDLAEQLEKEYAIKHVMLAPPQIIPVSAHLAEIVNSNLWRGTYGKYLKEDRYPEGSTAYVQRVQKIPFPNILIGCSPQKVLDFQAGLTKFLPQVQQKREFADELKKNWEKTKRMLLHETCLISDFQVLLDTKGQLHHIDLDRCFEVPALQMTRKKLQKVPITKKKLPTQYANKCLGILDDIEAALFQSIEGGNNATRATIIAANQRTDNGGVKASVYNNIY